LVCPSQWTVEDHLRDKPPGVIALYHRFVELVEASGPVRCSVSKTAITFKGSRRRFAGAKPTSRSLDGYLDLQQRVEDPRIRRATTYTERLFVHQFRVSAAEQLERQVRGLGSRRLRGRPGRPSRGIGPPLTPPVTIWGPVARLLAVLCLVVARGRAGWDVAVRVEPSSAQSTGLSSR
jgi:hypothetical protein